MSSQPRAPRDPEERITQALENGWGGPFTKEQQRDKTQREGDEKWVE